MVTINFKLYQNVEYMASIYIRCIKAKKMSNDKMDELVRLVNSDIKKVFPDKSMDNLELSDKESKEYENLTHKHHYFKFSEIVLNDMSIILNLDIFKSLAKQYTFRASFIINVIMFDCRGWWLKFGTYSKVEKSTIESILFYRVYNNFTECSIEDALGYGDDRWTFDG